MAKENKFGHWKRRKGIQGSITGKEYRELLEKQYP